MRLAVPAGFATLLGALSAAALPHRPASDSLALVAPNDNRRPAGRLRRDTLHIRLVVERARWKPEAPGDSGIVVAAFAEEGQAPRIPGPLIRVPAGTIIDAEIRNGLADSAITLQGFVAHPGARTDTSAVAPGGTVRRRFAAGAPGTYFYAAVVGHHDYTKDEERETSAGAFVVDPPGGSGPDRIFVINIWGRQVDSTSYANALAINGRSWPWTERISAGLEDSVRWRWVNATVRPHPMHLHGFYFRREGRGDAVRYAPLAGAERRLAVTEDLRPFSTFDLSWAPDRPGNWLFHCHIGFHVVAGAADLNAADTSSHREMSADPRHHMAGLVLGINVPAPRGWAAPRRPDVQRLRLFVNEGPRAGKSRRALGFVLQRGDQPPAPDSVEATGSLLTLTRGRPADITVVNRLKEPAIIHWHGIELESYSDGVPGWSGSPARVATVIQPGDSFIARLTLPRAGTFMYHTHFNDLEQLTSGLYGPIVVLEPGRPLDPAHDHVYVGGWNGPQGELLINGDSTPPAIRLDAGVPHRFRFIDIGMAGAYWPALRQDTTLVRWYSVAKDGAEFPVAQRTEVPALQRVQVGETWDFLWTPAPGTYRLAIGDREKPSWVQTIVVR